MKNLLIALLLVVGLFSKHSLQAQNLKTYSPLLNALNKTEKLQFLATLRGLTQSTQVGDQLQRDIFIDLKIGLPVTNPTAGIDSLLKAWSAGRTELAALLQRNSDEFKSKDIEAILGAYDKANQGWIKNLGAIQSGFTQYKDSLKVDLATIEEAEEVYKNSTVTMQKSLDKQYQEFSSAFLGNSSGGKIQWDKIVDNLLNDFGALEIGAGVQSLRASYYEEVPDSTTAMLVRFGSAPDYKQLWGAEWNAWVSFKGNQPNIEGANNSGTGYKSYLAGGNVSFQYRPEISFTKGSMRLITGVGASVESYLPTRINQSKPASLDNKGKTTGFGPEVRLGFAVTTGKLSFYSYSNRSKGFVLRCPDFPYDNWQVVSGIQWEGLHLRYAHGSTNWAKAENRHAVYNEVSVSIRIK